MKKINITDVWNSICGMDEDLFYYELHHKKIDSVFWNIFPETTRLLGLIEIELSQRIQALKNLE